MPFSKKKLPFSFYTKNLMPSAILLRITLLTGLILSVLISGALAANFLIERNQTLISRQQDNFFRMLREYDISASVFTGAEREIENLVRELDRMERRAISVESWLSILKRRRTLANRYPELQKNYINSINKALELFPGSQPLLALMSSALIKGAAITPETEEALRINLPHLTDPFFNDLVLSAHILLGDFNSPSKASVLPESLLFYNNENLIMNFAILRILNNDLQGAASLIYTLMNNFSSPSNDSIRFAAEYHYDFGELNYSAELFSKLEDDFSLLREADALFLADNTVNSRLRWTMLKDSDNPNTSIRSLYNLAVTSDDLQETENYLENLINIETETPAPQSLQFGLIRYSRLFDTDKAISVLQNTNNLNPAENPFIDLEIVKRQSQFWENRRRVAESWLLLDRHPENEDLHFWAAWLMSFQRFYDELRILVNRFENNETDFIAFFRTIIYMTDGDIDAAEQLLLSIPDEKAGWFVFANLGRIYETERSFRRALEQYEKAAALAENPKTASRIQQSIARCFIALGRPIDALLALENAVSLDPDNLSARLELERM